ARYRPHHRRRAGAEPVLQGRRPLSVAPGRMSGTCRPVMMARCEGSGGYPGMRSVNEWFGNYSRDHRHPVNRAIHRICVPVILWCVIALLWLVPVPVHYVRPGSWAVLAMFLAFLFYQRLSRRLGWAMAVVFITLAL